MSPLGRSVGHSPRGTPCPERCPRKDESKERKHRGAYVRATPAGSRLLKKTGHRQKANRVEDEERTLRCRDNRYRSKHVTLPEAGQILRS